MMVKLFKLWLPVIIWCGIIFYFSSISQVSTEVEILDFILPRFVHITEYFILTFLLYRAFKESFNITFLNLVFWTFSLSFLYGVLDEIHQIFVTSRFASPEDILVDTLGITAFYAFRFL